MKTEFDIKETEIRVLGRTEKPQAKMSRTKKVSKNNWRASKWIAISAAIIILFLLFLLAILYGRNKVESQAVLSNINENIESETFRVSSRPTIKETIESLQQQVTEVRDTVINDVPMRIYKPHYTRVSLQVGTPDIHDSTIVYITQAADVRADNQNIAGAFVMKGKPLSWGTSKKGYCAIIDNIIHLGMSTNTALFEEATAKKGYFFRQYPLVNNGSMCENKPKGKALRKAICQQEKQTFMVHSLQKESFHDFAQALSDLGCSHAIYLVGSNSFGWCLLTNGEKETWGNFDQIDSFAKNNNYLVFRK